MNPLASTWWQTMGNSEKIFWIIAVPFTLIFLIQLVMTFTVGDADGLDGDTGHDASFDADHGIDFQFLSIKNLMGFFAIFGWTGIAALHGGKSMVFAVLVATIAGLAMMTIMAALVYYLGKLTEDGTLRLTNAIGKTGTAYLRIPAARKGMGKVQINVQGFRTLDAITDEADDIPSGAVIKVKEVINDELLLVNSGKETM